jgi:hypothetical protein
MGSRSSKAHAGWRGAPAWLALALLVGAIVLAACTSKRAPPLSEHDRSLLERARQHCMMVRVKLRGEALRLRDADDPRQRDRALSRLGSPQYFANDIWGANLCAPGPVEPWLASDCFIREDYECAASLADRAAEAIPAERPTTAAYDRGLLERVRQHCVMVRLQLESEARALREATRDAEDPSARERALRRLGSPDSYAGPVWGMRLCAPTPAEAWDRSRCYVDGNYACVADLTEQVAAAIR